MALLSDFMYLISKFIKIYYFLYMNLTYTASSPDSEKVVYPLT